MTGHGPEDLIAGAHGAGDRAGDLRDPHPAAVGDGHLGGAHPQAHGLDLHLGRPAEVGVRHVEALQGVPADGAEGAEVGEAVAVEEADQQAGHQVPRPRLGEEGAPLAPAQHPRADHQLGLAGQDGRHQRRQLLRVVREVGVDEDDDVRRPRAPQVVEPGQAGAAVPPAAGLDHLGAPLPGHPGRAVGRAVVRHHHAADGGMRQGREHQGEGGLLVEGRDDDVDDAFGHPWILCHALERAPVGPALPL